jgi:hypothetical protein
VVFGINAPFCDTRRHFLDDLFQRIARLRWTRLARHPTARDEMVSGNACAVVGGYDAGVLPVHVFSFLNVYSHRLDASICQWAVLRSLVRDGSRGCQNDPSGLGRPWDNERLNLLLRGLTLTQSGPAEDDAEGNLTGGEVSENLLKLGEGQPVLVQSSRVVASRLDLESRLRLWLRSSRAMPAEIVLINRPDGRSGDSWAVSRISFLIAGTVESYLQHESDH